MIDEIIELLKKYTDKFVDEDYFTKLCKILVKYKKISGDDFFNIKCSSMEEVSKKFGYTKNFDFTKAFYYEPEGVIFLILDNITVDTKKWNSFDLSDQEHFIFSNLIRTVPLLHEFEHVVQKNGKSGLEGILIRDCLPTQDSSAYVLSPREHFANLYSFLIALSIAEKMGLSNIILNYFKREISVTLYNPYLYNMFDIQRRNKNENVPIFEFFHKIKRSDLINLSNLKELDFLSRVIFELGISDEEFENFSELLNIDKVGTDVIFERLEKGSILCESTCEKNENEIAEISSKGI